MGTESVSVKVKNKLFILGSMGILCILMLLINREQVQSKSSNKTARIKLGRLLFYDNRLSYNQTKSCVSCHDPNMAFTDGYRKSVGANGYAVTHNAPSLLNAVYRSTLTWKDSTVKGLKKQLHFPFFNHQPVELGWASNEELILQRLSLVPQYKTLFKAAFPTAQKWVTLEQVQTCIVAFEEQLVAYGSAYDLYMKGQKNALNQEAIKGMYIFNASKTKCSSCHQPEKPFQLHSSRFVDGIRVPSLRNVWLTAPYMHDGRLDKMEEVISYYETKFSFQLNKTERQQLLAFLKALTDTSYLSRRELLNPFQF